MNGLEKLIATFRKKLNDFILTNGSKIHFDQAQYTITEVENNGYEILLSVTGMGTQHFTVRVIEDEFLFRGKMVEMGTSTQFPHNLISDMVYGVVQEWFTTQPYPAKDIVEKGDLSDYELAGPKVLEEVINNTISEN